MENNLFEKFTNKYSVSKTLRFELIPQGKTLQNIRDFKVLEDDNERAENYKELKKIIDEYHKKFISESLKDFEFNEDIERYYKLSTKGIEDENDQVDFENLQKSLRKQLVAAFERHENYNELFKKELITKILPSEIGENEEDLQLVNNFKSFTTYFTGFHENRKNMYSDEEKSTAISFRVVNENLPTFTDNLRVYCEVSAMNNINEISTLLDELKVELKVTSLDEVFEIGSFNSVITQEGITAYNTLIGGRSSEDGVKVKGLNELINLHNQVSEKKYPKFKILKKQILSDRESKSFVIDLFAKDNELKEALKGFHQKLTDIILNDGSSLEELIVNLKNYNLDGIFIKDDQSLTTISQKMFGHWGVISDAILSMEYDLRNANNGDQNSEKYLERKDRQITKLRDKRNDRLKKSYSISFINQSLGDLGKSKDICDYFIGLGTYVSDGVEENNAIQLIDKILSNFATVDFDNSNGKIADDEELIRNIKVYLDSVKELQHFLKPLNGLGTESDKDAIFYGEFNKFYDVIDLVTPLYNKVRNYVTKKPFSTEKVKLNFSNAQLLNGWDVSKEKDYLSILLRKDSRYYLGIMNKDIPKVSKCMDNFPAGNENDGYEKMDYRLMPDPAKDLPKKIFSKKWANKFNPSDEILGIYKNGTFKKDSKDFSLDDLHKLIDFYKTSIKKEENYKVFDFSFSETCTYSTIADFYREAEKSTYKVSFKKIQVDYIDSLVNEGKLFLFQIYNKDFSKFSKGKKNLHTIYWDSLFTRENLENPVHKLNGQAEVFFRSGTPNNHIEHPKGMPIKSKREKDVFNKFEYDLIKDKRYREDKFFLHVPIMLNRVADSAQKFNDQVCERLKFFENTHVIGIDRGERHLLYISVIDQKGNIVHQESMNSINNKYRDKNGKEHRIETDYHLMLDKSEKERDEARKNWKDIENIKELKAGYLSHVVHQITSLMMEYNAIVVLEDLNFGFKRGRFHVEKQVYQKFEKALIDKLNFLVDKNNAPNDFGGIRNAFQLTNQFKSFKDIGKQTGFLFYVNAQYTSKIDPTTGFSNFLFPKYESVEKSKLFFRKFNDIRFNEEENYFEFHVDYLKFSDKKVGITDWVICSRAERIESFKNTEKNSQWDYRTVNLTQELMGLFSQNNIDYNFDLQKQICEKDLDTDFYKSLLRLLKLTLQMRNSNPNQRDEDGIEVDYIISPVKNSSEKFFDSREVCSTDGLPDNADANGAYNIALKGLMLIERMKSCQEGKRPNLAIKNEDWFRFIQKLADKRMNNG